MTFIIRAILIIVCPLASTTWGCNSTFLHSEVNALHTKICNGVEIQETRLLESLHFLREPLKLSHYKNETLSQEIQKTIEAIDNHWYCFFAKSCKDIYEKNDTDEMKIAVSILFTEVTKEYQASYTLEKKIETNKASLPLVNTQEYLNKYRSLKSGKGVPTTASPLKKPDSILEYPTIPLSGTGVIAMHKKEKSETFSETMRFLHLLDCMQNFTKSYSYIIPFEIKQIIAQDFMYVLINTLKPSSSELFNSEFFISMFFNKNEHPKLTPLMLAEKGVKCLKTLPRDIFQQITGVKPSTFEKMVECLAQASAEKSGLKKKLNEESMV
ncbi:hypothetical protein H0W26_04795, partial [Candidatus Dependentiae bacterium]|nr:hypothetical protein [Candidatus Dependentiae bacterium]